MDVSRQPFALLTVSVQYLIRPIEVFSEVAWTLRPGAPFIVTFSNRMFPTKAVAIWTQADDRQRVDLVNCYFTAGAAFEKMETIDRSSGEGDPIWAVLGYRKQSPGKPGG
jgi:hypothetical protein